MRFEWDENKNKANKLKHRISFEEAETVFDDKNAVYLYDESHSARKATKTEIDYYYGRIEL